MLATTRSPYLDLGFHQTPPRIISEIKKPTPAWPKDNIKPKISGELLCWIPSEGRWKLRRVYVRSGQLQINGVFNGGDDSNHNNARLPLRRLNLMQEPKDLRFALRRSQDTHPVLTLQASCQEEFDFWVRTIAIELIRQTPLDAIKYLDILTLTPQVHSTPKREVQQKDCNDNSIMNATPEVYSCSKFQPKSLNFNRVDENRNYYQNSKSTGASLSTELPINRKYDSYMSLNMSDSSELAKGAKEDEQTVELLLKKCQNSDSYVPVKEKLKLFESLCRLGRMVNNDDVAVHHSKYGSKRAISLHDLSNSEYPLQPSAGVKQICKYFENKNDQNKEKDDIRYNTIARSNRTHVGPVKAIISKKYSIKNY